MKTIKEVATEYYINHKGIPKCGLKEIEDGLWKHEIINAFIDGFEAAKNRLTIDELHVGLRMCNIDIHKSILDKVIDVCELIMDKSGDATISDVEELKLK